jgi:two-component system phosphate regulon response regulator PhoB
MAPTGQIEASGQMAMVLVVDDNLDICRAMGRLIRRAGFDAEWVTDGYEAVDHLRKREHLPDLVILDEMMPGLDGLGVLRQIREDHRTAALPVVMFTAMYDQSFRDRALAAGANDVWVKGSFDLDQLPGAIRIVGLREVRMQLDKCPVRMREGQVVLEAEMLA